VFGYDLLNRLTSVARTSGASETLRYDPFGMLLLRQSGSQVTAYLGGQATASLTLPAGCTAPGCGMTLTAVDVHLGVGGMRVASVRQGASPRTLYLYRDRLGSVVATTLAGGVKGASYRYGVYGALEASSGDAGNAASELGYAGAVRLSGGLLLMGLRVYSPAIRGFLQTDPLLPFKYDYTDGDPVNRVDPTGMGYHDWMWRRQCTGASSCTTVGGRGSYPEMVVSSDGESGMARLPDGRTFIWYPEGMAPPEVSLSPGGGLAMTLDSPGGGFEVLGLHAPVPLPSTPEFAGGPTRWQRFTSQFNSRLRFNLRANLHAIASPLTYVYRRVVKGEHATMDELLLGVGTNQAITFAAGAVLVGTGLQGGVGGVIESMVINNGGLAPAGYAVMGRVAGVLALRAVGVAGFTVGVVLIGSTLEAVGGAAFDQMGE